MKFGTALPVVALLFACVGPTQATDLRVHFRDRCPVTATEPEIPATEAAFLAPLAIALGTKFLEGAIDYGVDALVKSMKAQPVTLTGQINAGGFYFGKSISRDIGCLVIVAAKFSNDAGQAKFDFKEAFGATPNYEKELAKFLSIDGEPALYLEARMRVSDDFSAVSWEPQYFFGGNFINTSWWAGTRRDWAIAVQLSAPGGQKLGEMQFRFSNFEAPLQMRASQLGEHASSWMPVPTADANAQKSSKGADRANTPFTATVNLIETPKPHQLQALLVGAFESEKTNIATALKDSIIPARKDANAAAEKDANVAAIDAYATKWSEFRTACVGVDSADAGKVLACGLKREALEQLKTRARAANAELNLSLTIPDVPKDD